MSERVLVTGGRDYDDMACLTHTLDGVHRVHGIALVIHGGARGADRLAKRWAEERGIAHLPFPADWNTNGRAAGPIRNALMLTMGRPERVIAFPGGRGTADMVRRAKAAGLPVCEVLSCQAASPGADQ